MLHNSKVNIHIKERKEKKYNQQTNNELNLDYTVLITRN
jgi:hypothetical protein